jgi:hypothetical protein
MLRRLFYADNFRLLEHHRDLSRWKTSDQSAVSGYRLSRNSRYPARKKYYFVVFWPVLWIAIQIMRIQIQELKIYRAGFETLLLVQVYLTLPYFHLSYTDFVSTSFHYILPVGIQVLKKPEKLNTSK